MEVALSLEGASGTGGRGNAEPRADGALLRVCAAPRMGLKRLWFSGIWNVNISLLGGQGAKAQLNFLLQVQI